MNIKNEIVAIITKLEIESKEIDEMYEEEFNPSDWSGGNFDDAYNIGVEHGEVFGSLRVLNELLNKIEEEK